MSRNAELIERTAAALNSPEASWVMAAVWAGLAVLWAVLIARQRPHNASFAWRSLTAAVCVMAGAKCAARVLVASGDPAMADVLDRLNSIGMMVTMASVVVFRSSVVWAGDRSPQAYAHIVKERCEASKLEMNL